VLVILIDPHHHNVFDTTRSTSGGHTIKASTSKLGFSQVAESAEAFHVDYAKPPNVRLGLVFFLSGLRVLHDDAAPYTSTFGVASPSPFLSSKEIAL
jgi:hypothetical protein